MKRLAAALAVAALAACGSPGPPSPTTIVASDANVFVPALRIVREEGQTERDPSNLGCGGAFEFNYFYGRGSDSQRVEASDQPIKLGGVSFSGPQDVQHDFKLNWSASSPPASWSAAPFPGSASGCPARTSAQRRPSATLASPSGWAWR